MKATSCRTRSLVTPHRVHVDDINGKRVETVVSKASKNGQPILVFKGEVWAYTSDTWPEGTVRGLRFIPA